MIEPEVDIPSYSMVTVVGEILKLLNGQGFWEHLPYKLVDSRFAPEFLIGERSMYRYRPAYKNSHG